MKQKMIAALLLIASPSMSYAIDTHDEICTAAVVMSVVDIGQSLHIARDPKHYSELDPLLGAPHPSKETILHNFVELHLFEAWACYEHKEITWIPYVWLGAETAAVGHNFKIGLSVKF